MMSKKFVIVAGIILVVLAAAGYWLFGSKLWPGRQEQEQELGDEVSVLLATLEQEADIGFSKAKLLEFNWNASAEGKIKTVVISGRGFEIYDVSGEEQARIDSFFYDKGFEVDLYNIAAGTVSGAVGYKKDNLVCVVSGQIQLDESGLPLEGYKRDIQVKCGENNDSSEIIIPPSGD